MTLRSKSWQRGGAGSPSRRQHIPAELGGAARAGRRPGASPQLPEGADLEEAPRRRRLSEEVGPLTAEPWCPSHQPPGARSERARTAAVSAARAAGPAVATDQHPRAPPPWAPRPPASWTRASAPTSEVRPPGGPSGRARLGGGRPERVLVVRPGLRASSLYPLRPGSPGATPRGAAGARAAARDASGSARDGRERQVQAAGWGTTSLPPPRPPRGLACPASRPTPGRARRDTSPSGLWRWTWFQPQRTTGISLVSRDFSGDSRPVRRISLVLTLAQFCTTQRGPRFPLNFKSVTWGMISSEAESTMSF